VRACVRACVRVCVYVCVYVCVCVCACAELDVKKAAYGTKRSMPMLACACSSVCGACRNGLSMSTCSVLGKVIGKPGLEPCTSMQVGV